MKIPNLIILLIFKNSLTTEFFQTTEDNYTERNSPSSIIITAPRNLQANAWHSMNIKFDTSHLNQTSPIQLFLLNNLILPKITSMLSRTKVIGFGNIPPFNSTSSNCIFNPLLMTNYSTTSTPADLLIFLMNDNLSTALPATSKPCGLDFDTNRTTIGQIVINMLSFNTTFTQFRYTINLILKEMFHVMAFNNKLFPQMSLPSTSIIQEQSVFNSKITVTKIATPGILSLGINYFNCSNFSGIYIENTFGDSSGNFNWEKRILGNDIMVADYPSLTVLSAFTLTFLNDTKWYLTDPTQAEFLVWGNNEGCGFLSTACSNSYPEYCSTVGQSTCTSDFMSKSICTGSSLTDQCPIRNWYSAGLCTDSLNLAITAKYEQSGAFSRCFDVILAGAKTSGCYLATCVANYLNIQVQGIIFACGSTGQVITSSDLQIICPNVTRFCGIINNDQCPNDCSGVGVCTSNKICNCNPFFTGDSCATQFQCNSSISGPIFSGAQCTLVNNFTAPATIYAPVSFLKLISIFSILISLVHIFN